MSRIVIHSRPLAAAQREHVVRARILSNLILPGPPTADIVTDWNVVDRSGGSALRRAPATVARSRPSPMIAVHDALNAIDAALRALHGCRAGRTPRRLARRGGRGGRAGRPADPAGAVRTRP